MEPDFFNYLPSEITNNILTRLPFRTIAISKCVCKPWLHLLESDEFVNSHLAKSVPALAVLKTEMNSSSCTVYEFEDGLDLEHHDLHYNPLTEFDFPHPAVIQGSANGLLLLHKIDDRDLYVCNPITRDYIELHYPEEFRFEVYDMFSLSVACGFGVSKITGQHKVVLMCKDYYNDATRYECSVHTLGAESWRRIDIGDTFSRTDTTFGEFLNGNLHWIVSDGRDMWISCFDLETEHSSTLSTPPFENSERLCVLGDHLCFCDYTYDNEIVIWYSKILSMLVLDI